MAPISINKDVFEPSFDDLKFKIENHNYFCTNLNSNFGFVVFDLLYLVVLGIRQAAYLRFFLFPEVIFYSYKLPS